MREFELVLPKSRREEVSSPQRLNRYHQSSLTSKVRDKTKM